jgi:Predicted sugar nucleotidyltransferases
LVPYQGKTLLQYQLEVFKRFNITDITLIGGYHNEALPHQDYPVVVNKDFATTNMLYSLFCAEKFMEENSDIIISYGDIIYHPSVFEALLNAEHACDVITDVDWRKYWTNRMEDPLKDAETFRWDTATQKIFELGKKPKTLDDIQGQYIGLFKISASFIKNFKQMYKVFKDVHPNYKNAYMSDFLQFLIDEKLPVFGVPIHNHWAEFDTVNDLNLKASWL